MLCLGVAVKSVHFHEHLDYRNGIVTRHCLLLSSYYVPAWKHTVFKELISIRGAGKEEGVPKGPPWLEADRNGVLTESVKCRTD